MKTLIQDPKAPDFVQDPYAFYRQAREAGPFFHWQDYGLTCTGSAAAVNAILRDRRFGRECPAELAPAIPAHQQDFYAVEAHSMLELEPPRHSRLRNLVLRAFTSRRIAGLGPEITALCAELIANFPQDGDFDLLDSYARPIPVRIIARLLGVPEAMAPDLLRWSNAMVGMYQAGRSHAMEVAAATAAREFSDFLRGYVVQRRDAPADDLITQLITAEAEGEKLSTDELITTCILLLNAGHEATVHSIGNGVKLLLEQGFGAAELGAQDIAPITEEILRFDPALHMFTRWAYEEVEILGQRFQRGDQVALLLGMANRDPALFDQPERFHPARLQRPNLSFGAGLHFCIGAPLARLELQIALPQLFHAAPGLTLAAKPRYGDTYHFHGLDRLQVSL